ncbi:MAG: ATPase [Micrococcales bacterium]|nr:MAG: ATPase [Micrococcales bacterium]
MVLLAQGHLLIEDVPGVGKTVLAKALAKAVGGDTRRVQFTPDLLPSDITGVSIYNQSTREFEFKPGPVFTTVLLGDEINRASPKTQSAVLECLAEGQVTVDGVTYALADPFMLIATQNPVEMDGTYPLPEAQRDRFLMRLSLGYPCDDAELSMLRDRHGRDPLQDLGPVCDRQTLRQAITAVRHVYVAEEVSRYIIGLTRSTREHPHVRLGASPRASLHLLRAAQARAAMCGRDHVWPDDVQALARPVLAHRLLLSVQALREGQAAPAVIDEAVARQPVGFSRPGRY